MRKSKEQEGEKRKSKEEETHEKKKRMNAEAQHSPYNEDFVYASVICI